MSGLKFAWIFLYSTPTTLLGIALGGYWVWIGPLGVMLVMLVGDFARPADRSMPALSPYLGNLLLYLQLPASALALLFLAWSAAPGDLAGVGAFLQSWTTWPVLQRHADLSTLNLLGVAWSVGFLLSTNTVVAHEMIHRTHSLPSMIAGRWLLAMVNDSQFSISHVYGHHRLVGTPKDPATARRGEPLYKFVVRSALGQFVSAFDIERARLRNSGHGAWTFRNRFLRGQFMTLTVVAVILGAAGLKAVALFVLCSTISKFLFEAVNYIQHYGLVRVEGTPVEPRHSWDCIATASGAFLFNLTRHADHHAHAELPFWELKPAPRSIIHKTGYMGGILLAMIPPIWKRVMGPQLRRWDTELASSGEAALLSDNAAAAFR